MARSPKAGVGSNQYVTRSGLDRGGPRANQVDVVSALDEPVDADPNTYPWDDIAAAAESVPTSALVQYATGARAPDGAKLTPQQQDHVIYKVSERSDITGDQLTAIADYVLSPKWRMGRESAVHSIVLNPACPPEVIRGLVPTFHSARTAATSNPNCPADCLDRIAAGEDRFNSEIYLEAVARHRNTSPERLDMLSRQRGTQGDNVKRVVGANPNCPPKVLDRLIKAKSNHVVGGAAQNPRLTARQFDRIAASSRAVVRGELAENPNLPASTLARLSHDPDPSVRATIARRDDCPADVLERLALDSHPDVRGIAVEHPNCPETGRIGAAFLD